MRIVAHIVEASQGIVYAGYSFESREIGRRFRSLDDAREWIEDEAAQLSARLLWEEEQSFKASTAS
jgi:hypothetical protein